jgi:outer membrane lipoprotein-sorting protein
MSFSFSSRSRLILVFLAIIPLTGCLFRSRAVKPPVALSPLKEATQADLIDYINAQAARIKTMQATVDIDTSVGGEKKGTITDYKQIRGYVLARKPAMLRMIGLLPIVRTRAFDMVSDGREFKLWIPPKNRFVIGRNDVESHNTQQPLENLRPQVIYDALLMLPIDPAKEIAVMENGSESVIDAKGHRIEQPAYFIDVISKGQTGWSITRKIVFSRTNLLPDRQMSFDENGQLATDTRYSLDKDYDGVTFPTKIEIKRPQEEYDITLTIVKLELNKPLVDEKFALEQPAGAEVVRLSQAGSSEAGAAHGPGRRQ